MGPVLLAVAILGGMQEAPLKRPATPRFAQHDNLAVYPVFDGLGSARTSDYLTLDEGLKSGQVVITERGSEAPMVRPRPGQRRGTPPVRQIQGDRGDVNTLWLTNRSGKKLLLLAGEMVQGGKQDRILEKDAIIPPGKEPVDLSVYCVEHGRWSYSGGGGVGGGATALGGFMPAPAASQPSVRKAAQEERSQQQVWERVDTSLKGGGAVAPTRAYRMNLEDKSSARRLEAYVRGIEARFPAEQAVGAIVAVNGRLVWMDVFPNNELFRKYWPKLLKSYALEAMTTAPTKRGPPSFAEAMAFARDRDGKTSYEVEQELSKLIKVEGKGCTLFELQDVSVRPPARLHVNKMLSGR